MQRAIVLVVVALALLGLGWILFGPKGKAGLDPAQGARFALGREDAPVTVVDFSNYLCPHCQNHALNVLPRLKAEYIDTGKVRYLFRDFPFPGQANVIRASEAAACAADQGRYYEYHEVLFRTASSWANLQGSVLDRYLVDLAGQMGLDENTFSQCLSSNKHREGVLADQKLATDLGLTGTPTFFIAGEKRTGFLPYEEWKTLLDKALAEKK
ncbi:thiol:disulfide interchange protein [Thermus scotoductus]|uniref:Thiol:disulfide interchange protein n=1 Tax=Thermus scotoductus TaxID=37636 RepID=A0A430UL68_THESC|nr:DsbA family protein [Thermus scotoductus]RTI04535.1 thiol:disulfide interchange protein [Thermus scotoductus]